MGNSGYRWYNDRKILLPFCICWLLTAGLFYGQVVQVEYLKDGIELYKKGKLEEAYYKLETALKEARELTPEVIRFFVFNLEKDILVEMIVKGGKLAKTAKRILELSKAAMEGYKADEAELEKLINVLKDEKTPFDKKHIAINKLVLIGKNAIPHLVSGLGDEKNETFRTNSIITLTKFGGIATIPLISALSTDSVLQKRNILIVLSNIANKVASPYFSKISNNPKEDEGVKAFARKTLSKWFPQKRISPKALFTKYAHYILSAPPKLEKDMEDLASVWRFENGALKYTPVYSFETKYLLSESFLLEALKYNRNYFAAQVFLVLTYVKYYLQVEGYWRALKGNKEREKLKEVRYKVKKRFESIASFPTPVLYEVLKRSIAAKEYDSAEEIIKILSVNSSFEDSTIIENSRLRGEELYKSLVSADKPVRYSSCLAILKWQPDKTFPNVKKWHKIGEEVLSEESIWRILFIGKDQKFYNKLKKVSKFTRLNITQTDDPKKALFLARSFPAFDIIMVGIDHIDDIVYSVQLAGIDEKNEPKKVDIYLLKALSEDVRLKYTPIIAVLRNAQEKAKVYQSIFTIGNEGDIKDIIYKDESASNIAGKLKYVLEGTNLYEESRIKADNYVLQFEKELQKLDINKTALNWKYLIPQIIKNAEYKKIEISLEAIRALGNLLDSRSVAPLVRIAADSTRNFEQRKESLLSLINIVNAFPESLTDTDIQMLLNIVKTSQTELRALVPKVLGKAKLDPKIRIKLVEELKK